MQLSSNSNSAQTPSQTVGPYFAIGMVTEPEHILVNDKTRGARIVVLGQVLDGDNLPVTDALVEIWQPDADGIFPHPDDPNHANVDPNFSGFGRSKTEEGGHFRFDTVRPGSVGEAAPYINVRIFSRGILIHAVTRIYFEDEPKNNEDPVLKTVPADRRTTLLAKRIDNEALVLYHFDIHLQGAKETVFFDV